MADLSQSSFIDLVMLQHVQSSVVTEVKLEANRSSSTKMTKGSALPFIENKIDFIYMSNHLVNGKSTLIGKEPTVQVNSFRRLFSLAFLWF